MAYVNVLRGILGFFEHAAIVFIGFVLMVIGLGPGRDHDHAARGRRDRLDRLRDVRRWLVRPSRRTVGPCVSNADQTTEDAATFAQRYGGPS
jgi:hypothetical protein